ncbi:Ig-like domain-containing protein [Microvirga guangxiensis]|uniref:Parallel beta-helix repeat (Two copies) n=1 Tax=Microvirga guangxiensis TaxID=549386 RepID=A0A1G5I6W0_9HYPH|nr:Ig-like domain-containing protein [Microvirga guangxiensis]SCY71753.1 parallel beta-helix repeat (two copies) [Microvirga guangxiensis]
MATIYVSTTGSDSNSGASGSPVKTISKASQLAKAGDTVLVGAGTYKGLVTISSSGSASAPITYKPVDGAKVIIDGAGTPTNSSLVTISGNYVVFQGFEVQNAQRTGISLWESHDVKVLNNKVHDSVRAGIFSGASSVGTSYNNVIEGNEVWNNVKENTSKNSSSGWAQAIGAYASDNLTIRNNKSYDNWGEGIGVQSSMNAKILNNTTHDNFSVNIYLDNAQAAVVQGNTVYTTNDTTYYRNGKAAWGIRIANEHVDRPLPSKDIVITNNVLAGSGEIGYGAYEANTGLINPKIENNTFYSSYTQIPNLENGGTPAPTPTPTPTPLPPIDNPVTAADDFYSATEDTVLTVAASKGVLANDTAADGGKAAVAGTFATAKGGSVKLNADGSFSYTPKADFFGSDSFTYTVKDADGDTDIGTVTFSVADVAETPSTPLPPTAPTTPSTPTPTPTPVKTINGTSRSNSLNGTSGNDKIDGKGGNDKINGKGGNDILIGGSGKDTFTFDTKLGSTNVDVIVDFKSGQDIIDLNDSVFTKLKVGKLSASAFVVGEKALDASDRIIYNNKTGDLYYDADGSGSGEAVKFATIENKVKLSAYDFYVI